MRNVELLSFIRFWDLFLGGFILLRGDFLEEFVAGAEFIVRVLAGRRASFLRD